MMTGPGTPSKNLDHSELVRAAILAPTPDNNQPWLFASGAGELRVYLDPERSLPSDVNSMFDLVGLGAAVENTSIAARQMGYGPNVEYASTGPGSATENGSQPAVTMTFTPGGQRDPLYVRLDNRCTCRKLYSTRPVAQRSLDTLADAGNKFSDVQLDWIGPKAGFVSARDLSHVKDKIEAVYRTTLPAELH